MMQVSDDSEFGGVSCRVNPKIQTILRFPLFLGIICYSQRSLSFGFSENLLVIIHDFTWVAGEFYFKTKFEDTVILLTNPEILNWIENFEILEIIHFVS